MSTRDEILQALGEHPDGLTSKELAPLCPAAECDLMIVGRIAGALGQEDLIHHGGGFREGAMIWLLGPKKDSGDGPKLTLPSTTHVQTKSEISRAAQDIAAMRQKPPTGRGLGHGSGHPTTPATTTDSASPRPPAVQQETPMSDKKPIKERVREALTKHGKLKLLQLSKVVGTTTATLSSMMGKLKDEGIVKSVPNERGVYVLGGSSKEAAPPRSDPQPQKPERKPKKALKVAPATRVAVPPKHIVPRVADGAQFAINEIGELGISKEETKVSLEPAEFARLREFIQRTQPVWKGAE